jgi:uncharacterized membrane protein YphA (DoxX/SURF4 family)
MSRISRSNTLERLRPHAFDLIRFYLGIGLLVRGAIFVANPGPVLDLIRDSGDWFWPMALTHAVAMSHFAGGLLLAAGFMTRFVALVQIPPVLGAVVFLHLEDGLFTRGQSLEFSVLVLFLLGLFAAFGAGRWSFDHQFLRTPLEGDETAREQQKRALA